MTKGQQKEAAGQVLCRRYRLEEPVGQGAAAAVYRAVDEALGRQVALKVLFKEGGEPELLAGQEAEIRILASLIHPSLVTLFDAGVDPVTERRFVVMEYVAGPNLRQHLRAGDMTPGEIAAVGSDLASALDYVHSKGVIHRDIKPGNVLVYKLPSAEHGSQWRAKLADFGIARKMEEEPLTETGHMVGTAAYLSPEQALGQPLNGASDVYSLGLVLLECFTRKAEFPGGQIESGVARLDRDPVIPDTVGPVWKALLASMTARDPADRPTPAAAASKLQNLAEARNISARSSASIENQRSPDADLRARPPLPSPEPTLAPPAPWKPGTRLKAAIGASLAAAILVSATSGSFGGSSRNQQFTTNQTITPNRTALPPQNNPLDFHLNQLEAALQPALEILPLLDQARQAITVDDLQTALAKLNRLEKDAADQAAANHLTFEQYRNITTALRLVRADLQTLIAAPTESAVAAIPAGPAPAPTLTATTVPTTGPEPAPAIVIDPPPTLHAGKSQVTADSQTAADPGAADKPKRKTDNGPNQGVAKEDRQVTGPLHDS